MEKEVCSSELAHGDGHIWTSDGHCYLCGKAEKPDALPGEPATPAE